jgi:hypothetical protein
MAAVRNLANQNRTVVCTIPQPSIEVRMPWGDIAKLVDTTDRRTYTRIHTTRHTRRCSRSSTS